MDICTIARDAVRYPPNVHLLQMQLCHKLLCISPPNPTTISKPPGPATHSSGVISRPSTTMSPTTFLIATASTSPL